MGLGHSDNDLYMGICKSCEHWDMDFKENQPKPTLGNILPDKIGSCSLMSIKTKENHSGCKLWKNEHIEHFQRLRQKYYSEEDWDDSGYLQEDV